MCLAKKCLMAKYSLWAIGLEHLAWREELDKAKKGLMIFIRKGTELLP